MPHGQGVGKGMGMGDGTPSLISPMGPHGQGMGAPTLSAAYTSAYASAATPSNAAHTPGSGLGAGGHATDRQSEVRSGQIGGGGGGNIDAKSSASGGSGTTYKALSRLRRSLGEQNQPLLPGLKYLRLVGVLLTILAVGLVRHSCVRL